MRTHSLSILGALTYLPSQVVAQTGSGGNCTTFNWNQQPGYLDSGATIRVSGASTCQPQSQNKNETHDCPITARGVEQASFSYSHTAPFVDSDWDNKEGGSSYLYNLVLGAVNSSLQGAPWPYYILATVATTEGLSPGTSGYINFTPFRRCFDGTMSGCTGGLSDGLNITACAPVYSNAAGAMLEGSFEVVKIPQDSVNRYPNPYANMVQGGGGTSGAHRFQISFLLTMLGAMVALMVSSL